MNQLTQDCARDMPIAPPLEHETELLELRALRQAYETELNQRQVIEYQLRQSQQLLQLVMDTLPEAIFWKDHNSVYLGCNRNFAADAGFDKPEDLIGKTDYDLAWKQEESDFFRECDRRVMLSRQPELGIVEPQLQSDGKQAWLETNKAPLFNVDGQVIGILGTYQDVTARKATEVKLNEMNQRLQQQAIALNASMSQLEQSQIELVKREKASALGNLVSGIAHEINNPLGFLCGNLKPAQAYTRDLFELISQYQTQFPDPGPAITATIEEIDLDYLRQDLPKLLSSMQEGVNRIEDISTSLRTFSRSDPQAKVPFKISEGIDSTVMILRHRLKANSQRPAIKVITDYGDLPNVICFPGQLNQVFMNLLANAIDALEDGNVGCSFSDLKANPNRITIRTRLVDDWAQITIADNGVGMSPEIQQQVFGHQFTTKAVGRGTGLGLTISYQIVVEKHSGMIQLNSELGVGTTFTIAFPIRNVELD